MGCQCRRRTAAPKIGEHFLVPFHKDDYIQWIPIYKGAESKVYLAQQISLNRLVIIKENIHGDMERFKNEAEVLASLNHSAINRVYEYGEHSESFYIVQEYIQGVSVRRADMSNDLIALDLFKQVVEGVQYLHEKGLLHSDLKPDNVVINRALSPILIDFGMVVQQGDDQAHAMNGTPYYFSPEHVGNTQMTVQSDVFSLGALLYYMLSGLHYFKHDSLEEVIHSIRTTSRDFGAIPKLWHSILERCLDVDREKRFEDCDELLECLEIVEQEIQNNQSYAEYGASKSECKSIVAQLSQKQERIWFADYVRVLYREKRYTECYPLLKKLVSENSENVELSNLLVAMSKEMNEEQTPSETNVSSGKIIAIVILVILCALMIMVYTQYEEDAPAKTIEKKEVPNANATFDSKVNERKKELLQQNKSQKFLTQPKVKQIKKTVDSLFQE